MMMNNDFDPYDTLIQCLERISRLEHAHNKLAIAYDQSQHDLTQALKSIRHLQQVYLRELEKNKRTDQ